MRAAWTGTIQQLKDLFSQGSLLQEITEGFEKFFFKSTEKERNSWSESIPAVLEVLADSKFNDLQALIELSMPVGAERADLVLLGGNNEAPRAIILELKQWSHVQMLEDTLEIDVPMIGMRQHPSVQALNYAGKLHFYNAQAHNYEIKAVAFLHNARLKDATEISRAQAKELTQEAPIITYDNQGDLCTLVEEFLLPIHLPEDEAEKFGAAPYKESKHLFAFLSDHANEIAQGAAVALANTGMGLTEEQDGIVEEILFALKHGQSNSDFIIRGAPGSGKTLLAVTLLLRAARLEYSCVLAIRNNRLQAILREVFNRVAPGLSGMMMFFEPRQGQGIANFEGHVNLLICDEAQRMEQRIMPSVLSKADVTAIFLDESQRLNPPEQGTIENFTSASRQIGRKSTARNLSSSIRIPIAYQTWIEKLLLSPQDKDNILNTMQKLEGVYDFQFTSTVEYLITKLQNLKSTNSRVALVAGFTESPGNLNNANAPDNLRIGYPLTSGFDLYRNSSLRISWLMSTVDYRKYWLGGYSNQLGRVASIYGAQGFESDYVGVIWGRDLVYRDGIWRLGDPNSSYDTIDRLITGRVPNRRWNEDALTLLINRYRIFLSRGIMGTFVWFEDAETREYFASLSKFI